jgi:hypothetical protein
MTSSRQRSGRPVHYSASPLFRFSTSPFFRFSTLWMDGWTQSPPLRLDFVLALDKVEADDIVECGRLRHPLCRCRCKRLCPNGEVYIQSAGTPPVCIRLYASVCLRRRSREPEQSFPRSGCFRLCRRRCPLRGVAEGADVRFSTSATQRWIGALDYVDTVGCGEVKKNKNFNIF